MTPIELARMINPKPFERQSEHLKPCKTDARYRASALGRAHIILAQLEHEGVRTKACLRLLAEAHDGLPLACVMGVRNCDGQLARGVCCEAAQLLLAKAEPSSLVRAPSPKVGRPTKPKVVKRRLRSSFAS